MASPAPPDAADVSEPAVEAAPAIEASEEARPVAEESLSAPLEASKDALEPSQSDDNAPATLSNGSYDQTSVQTSAAEGQEDYSEAWRAYYAAQEAAAAGPSQQPAQNGYSASEEARSPDPSGSSAPSEKKAGHATEGKGERGVLNPQKIYIGGLPEHTSQEDLQDCFGQIGEVLGVELKNGFGFVEFADQQAAGDAVAKYHGGHFLGAEIRVELSHNGSRAKPYVGGEAGACFKCGRSGHWARDCQMPGPGPGGRGGPPMMGRGRGFGPPHMGFPGPPMGRGFPGGPHPGFQPFPPRGGPPMQGGYDPRAPFQRPHDNYYRREQHPGQFQGPPGPPGFMHGPPGGPGFMHGPPGGPPYQQQHPYGGAPPFMPPPQQQRGSAWGSQPGSPNAPGSPTFGAPPNRAPGPYPGFDARPGDSRDYGAPRPYDPTAAAARERSPQRRRSLSPGRRNGSFVPMPPNPVAAPQATGYPVQGYRP